MGFQGRFFATVVAVLLGLCSGIPSASAQVRTSAASRNAPVATPNALSEMLPDSVLFAGQMNVEQVATLFGAPLNSVGIDGSSALRAGLETIIRDEFGDRVPFDAAAIQSLAFGGSSVADRSLVLLSDLGVLMDGRTPPADADYQMVTHGSALVIGEGAMLTELLAPDSARFDLATTWPAAATALAGADLGWVYIADPELISGLDHELRQVLTRASITRFAFGASSDAGWTLVLDGDPTLVNAELSHAVLQAFAGAASLVPQFDFSPLVSEWITAFVTRLRRQEVDGAIIVSAPPTCAGVLPQMLTSSLFAAAVVQFRAVPDDAEYIWPETPAAAGECDYEDPVAALLPWNAAHLFPQGVAGGTTSSLSDVAIVADVGRVARGLISQMGGLAAYPLNLEALAEAATEPAIRDALTEAVPIAVWGTPPTSPSYVSTSNFLDALDVSQGTQEIVGLGHTNATIPANLDLTLPLPAEWQAVQNATPADAPFAIAIAGNVLAEIAQSLPAPLRGPTSTAIGNADRAVISLDDGQFIVRLLGADPALAPRVQEHLQAVLTDAITLAGTMPQVGTRAVDAASDFPALWQATALDGSVGDGIEIRFATSVDPVVAGALFGFGSTAFLFGSHALTP